MHPRKQVVAAALAGGLLLTGCTNDPAPIPSPPPAASGSASASATPSASPTPTSTLTPAEQRAVDEATEVILAYEQMIVDLQADPTRPLNDINDVVAQPQLPRDLHSLQEAARLVAEGKLVVLSTGPAAIASVEPVKVDLKGDPPTVTLQVCLDQAKVRSTYEGKPVQGDRQELRYRVVKTTYLPDPGWAVSKVLPPKGYEQPQPC